MHVAEKIGSILEMLVRVSENIFHAQSLLLLSCKIIFRVMNSTDKK